MSGQVLGHRFARRLRPQESVNGIEVPAVQLRERVEVLGRKSGENFVRSVCKCAVAGSTQMHTVRDLPEVDGECFLDGVWLLQTLLPTDLLPHSAIYFCCSSHSRGFRAKKESSLRTSSQTNNSTI